MLDAQFLQTLSQPQYFNNVVRDGTINQELQKLRQAAKDLSQAHQELLMESRDSLAAASESTVVIIDLWGKVLAGLQAISTDLSCCPIPPELSRDRVEEWKRARQKLEIVQLVASFIENESKLPNEEIGDDPQAYVASAPLSDLLRISANSAVREMLNNHKYAHTLVQLDLTKKSTSRILALAQAIRSKVQTETKAVIQSNADVETITQCLLIMENLGIIDNLQLKNWLTEDYMSRVAECTSLEDCVAIMKPFCETVLRASAVSLCAASIIGSEVEGLRSLRKDVWNELATRLSKAVKSVLEQQGTMYIQSLVDFQNGLNRISMAKHLESTVNMMAFTSEGNPRMKLKLRGTLSKLNAYITTRLAKQYRVFLPTIASWNGSVDDIERAVRDVRSWTEYKNCVPKSDAIETIDILNKLLIMIESLPDEIPETFDTILKWLYIANTINTHCATDDYSINYLISNLIKMSKHAKQIANKLNLQL